MNIDYFHRIIEAIIQELTRGSFYNSSMEHSSLTINYSTLNKSPFAKDRIINCNINMGKLIVDAGRGVICYDEKVFQQLFLNLKEGGIGAYNAIVQIFYMAYHIFKGNQKIKGVSKKDIKKYIKSIKVRADFFKPNYATKFHLIQALMHLSENKEELALKSFNLAYVNALETENLWDLALVCEEYGTYLLNQSYKVAGLNMLSQALAYYQQWGAISIVERLKSDYPEITFKRQSQNEIQIETDLEKTNLTENQIHEIIKVFSAVVQASDLKTQLDILIGSALKYSKSTMGKFIIIDENRYQLFASKDINQDIILVKEGDRLEKEIPLNILRLISRRKISLIMSNINANPQYRKDPYIQNQGLESAIFIPIVKNKEVQSILLLENSMSKEKDIEIKFLETLCTQAGLAIENSILTELLEEKLQARSKQIQKERDRSNKLLRNILPEAVAQELKVNGKIKARKFENVSVLFTDFKDFTKFSELLNADQIIEEIDICFKAFDAIVEKYNIEKIKTIGDAYMCAGGIPEPRENHESDIVKAGLEMIQYIKESNTDRVARGILALEIRAGIHTGPVIAGIVGSKKYAYDIWGPTVNIAARMESSGESGKLNVSGATYMKIKDTFSCEFRGQIKAKSVGEVDMYFVED
jgi:class 3 adenylate cyclase